MGTSKLRKGKILVKENWGVSTLVSTEAWFVFKCQEELKKQNNVIRGADRV